MIYGFVSGFKFEIVLELEFDFALVLASVKIKNPTWKTQDFEV